MAPGNAGSTAFTIKNLGTQVEQFRAVVTGPEWLAVEPATMTVYPGDEATGTIQAAPPRKPGSVAGVTPFRLTVTSALHAHVSSSVSGRVDVAPFYELAAELVPTSSNGRGRTRHGVNLDNRGNTPLRVALNPTDVADGLRLGVPAFADVPPGKVVEVPVSVYGSRRWIRPAGAQDLLDCRRAPEAAGADTLVGHAYRDSAISSLGSGRRRGIARSGRGWHGTRPETAGAQNGAPSNDLKFSGESVVGCHITADLRCHVTADLRCHIGIGDCA